MQLPGLNIGIVADDLTGACDTALQFFTGHTETHVLLGLDALKQETGQPSDQQKENQVWSINTSTRHMGAKEAEFVTRQAVALCRDRYGVDNFYKKIDSTLRGHIAQECLGMLEELRAQCAVVVPAYPQEGRRTVGGYQLVRGIPVEKTVVARDPLFPVRQSHIPTMLEQASRPEIVGYIPLSCVLHGAGPILVKLNELIKDGKKLVVIDAASTEDLEQIALAIEKAQKNAHVLACGSAGLAQALARLWAQQPEEGPVSLTSKKAPSELSSRPSPILMVSGSTTEVTRQQIQTLVENYPYYGQGSQLSVVEVPPDQLLGLNPLEPLVQRVVNVLGSNNAVVLASSFSEEHYRHTLNLAAEHALSEEEASQRVQAALASITQAVLAQVSAKLILTGGETTCAVCKALDSRQLKMLAEADVSIPLLTDYQGRWIVTKSGGFGTPMALVNVIQFIKQRESSSIHA